MRGGGFIGFLLLPGGAGGPAVDEYAVGKVSYGDFARHYQMNRQRKYVVLQGHAAMWSAAMFEDFKRIVELLVAEGWIFVTPAEFCNLETLPDVSDALTGRGPGRMK